MNNKAFFYLIAGLLGGMLLFMVYVFFMPACNFYAVYDSYCKSETVFYTLNYFGLLIIGLMIFKIKKLGDKNTDA